jgi:deazaflavin-dependent oxidoreductase (nitroreductase family)
VVHDVGVDDVTKRHWVRLAQHYVLNPPVKAAVWTGLAPGYVIVETTGRRSGKLRHNVVGMKVDGNTGWVVAEHGRHAGYVHNLMAHPEVRVRIGRHWREAHAEVVDDDDAQARLDSIGHRSQALAVRTFGTELTTIRFDFAPEG